MTHDYKGTLDALNKWNCIDRRLNHKAREFGRDQAELFLECNLETIRSALKLAQEAEQLRLKLSETAIHLAARNSEIEQLRKERDEFARAIIKIHEDQEGDYDFLKFISHPQYILAKKVVGE